jgi:hypothetical protein
MTISACHPGELGVSITPQVRLTPPRLLRALPTSWAGACFSNRSSFWLLKRWEQPDCNLFVLGEVGGGRSSLLESLMRRWPQTRPSTDLCYLHSTVAETVPFARTRWTGAVAALLYNN